MPKQSNKPAPEDNRYDFAVIGLGRMGWNLILQAADKGFHVAGYTRGAAPGRAHPAGFLLLNGLATLRERLQKPRRVFVYIPAGPAIDELLLQLSSILEAGDIVLDGGNSYWGDSIRRAQRMSLQGIDFLDLGTSGGVDGARNGACFMIGGPKTAVDRVAPVLRRLAVNGGYVHAGPSGAGHFTKLVHNGIEFGMLQAIGEGMALLNRYPQRLPINDIVSCWRNGSVIRSWLIDLLEQRLRDDNVKEIPAVVEDTGEVNWLVADALELDVPVPVIATSVFELSASRDRAGNAARAIAMMRHGFGGHPYGRSKALQKERRTSRVGGYVTPRQSSSHE